MTVALFRRRCAWCRRGMGFKIARWSGPRFAISHGMCRRCQRAHEGDAKPVERATALRWLRG